MLQMPWLLQLQPQIKSGDMKIYWVNHLIGVEDYDSEKHKLKMTRFNYWHKEELIVAGDLGGHYDNAQAAKKFVDDIPDRKPEGAGSCSAGKTLRWNSYGYGIETPEDLKAIILDVLGLSG